MFGFITTRCVVSEATNQYWNQSYRTIRKHYPKNMVMIIDDHSDPRFVRLDEDLVLGNCVIISSEFRGAGEILPYYYFLKYRLFDKAVILHDSVFFNNPDIDFNRVDDVLFLWHFTQHQYDNVNDEVGLLGHLRDRDDLVGFYFQKTSWHGCFGGQSVISYDFLRKIEDRHSLSNIVHHIKDRCKRYAVERVLGCILTFYKRSLHQQPSLLGSIYKYMSWGYTYEMYMNDPKPNLPLVKVWSER